MDKEKFFKALGITAGEWINEFSIINNGQNDICQVFHNKDEYIICAAKDMAIDLIDSVRFFNILMDNIISVRNEAPGFFDYVNSIYNNKRKTVEKAIGKAWDEIMQIWEECQERKAKVNE